MVVDKFWKNARDVFDRKQSLERVWELVGKFPGVDTAYGVVLERGGIHVFSRALRVFGLTEDPRAKSLLWWNEPATWKSEYRDFFSDSWAFAEDVFGNQFMFDDKQVVWLQVETGELKPICATFTEWIQLVLGDAEFYTGARIAQAWEQAHPDEPLTGMYHLCPVKLFVCGGEYDLQNLFRLPAEHNMVLKADIARQIKNVPNGTEIEFRFED
jgi:hypothetical protein